MGAILNGGACTFRCWAPDASAVWVAGDFTTPTWDAGKIAMARDSTDPANEGHSYWSAAVPAVAAGRAIQIFYPEPRRRPRESWRRPFWKLDPYCSDATSSTGNSLVVDPAYTWNATSFRMPNFNEMVIYELHIGTFNAQPGQVGTFADAIGRLGYLQSLGINAIEVMPAENFDTDTSMGYNPSLPFAIDTAYGTSKAVQQFVDAAHALGIAVIFDVVYNHFGPESAGIGACLWQFDGWSQNSYGGIYLYNDDRASCPWGGMNRPDFWPTRSPPVSSRQCDDVGQPVSRRRPAAGFGRQHPPDHRQQQPVPRRQSRWLATAPVHQQRKKCAVPWTITIAEDLQNNDWVTKTTRGRSGV